MAASPPSPGTFGHLTDTAARWAATARRAVLLAALLYPVGLAFHLNLIAADGDSVAIDFVAFWAAAKLAVQGVAVSAFDWPTLSAAQLLPSSAPDAYFGWHYPPTFHLLIAPLGLLAFTPAFWIFTACGVAAYYFAIRPWGRAAPAARDLAIASPAVCATVFTGNTTLLWAAAFLAAIHCLSRHRPAQAAVFIALLTLKPQLGLLIPVALIAGRHWPALLWATLFTAGLAILATVVFGADYWLVFIRMMAATGQTFAADQTISGHMISWYAFARQFGAGHETALVLQTLALAIAAGAVGLLWSRRADPIDLKIAGLCLATLIATPYAFQYELVLAVVAALFLARAGVGTSAPGRAGLALLWLLPVPGRLIGGLEFAHYAAPVLTAALALCLLRAWSATRAARAQAATP